MKQDWNIAQEWPLGNLRVSWVRRWTSLSPASFFVTMGGASRHRWVRGQWGVRCVVEPMGFVACKPIVFAAHPNMILWCWWIVGVNDQARHVQRSWRNHLRLELPQTGWCLNIRNHGCLVPSHILVAYRPLRIGVAQFCWLSPVRVRSCGCTKALFVGPWHCGPGTMYGTC